MTAPGSVPLRSGGLQCHELAGPWELVVGPEDLAAARLAPGAAIKVPGLWEAQGWAGLDGPAWYRAHFDLESPGAAWALCFGGVMDVAEVYLNGALLGTHHEPFTPFELECGGHLRDRGNELMVMVTDIARGTPEHGRMAHGKQGWMNHVFPSPPSLYLDYGGIWQPVWLERHGPVRLSRLWSNCRPHRFSVWAKLFAGTAGPVEARVELEVFGRAYSQDVVVDGEATARFDLGDVADQGLWWPEEPVLHALSASAWAEGQCSDRRTDRTGLRDIQLVDGSFRLNGRPFSMRSALVQGFSRRTLYGGVDRAEAEDEVAKARALGLNTLRLHIKAFDPVYLDVCDELGMMAHCDIPVAEPVAHDELGAEGPLADACAAAAAEQVRRDLNHPCIVLWSAMNELGAEALPVRQGPGYEAFARRLYQVVQDEDGTRPVIENDWVEPGPDRVFCSPLLTAHWYGRLSASYLEGLRSRVVQGSSTGRPLFMSEFGDWGLPSLAPGAWSSPPDAEAPFWDYRSSLSQLVEASYWEGTVDEFVRGTQLYQGLADRLQVELFRGLAGMVGWCVTELTDVPQEFNGLLDIDRAQKGPACAEVRAASQRLLPILQRGHWSAPAGGDVRAALLLDNDGPALAGAEVVATLGASSWSEVVDVPAYGRLGAGTVELPAGEDEGTARLEVEVRHEGTVLAANYYPVRVVAQRPTGVAVATDDQAGLAALLARLGRAQPGAARPGSAVPGPTGPLAAALASPERHLMVVEEGGLSHYGELLPRWLGAGGSALLLAQDAVAGPLAAVLGVELSSLATEWGSTPFIFTNLRAPLPSLPGGQVLATELLSTTPEHVYTRFGLPGDAAVCAVGVLKPPPGPVDGLVVGQRPVLGGTLTVCQLPLIGGALKGDALCRGLFVDLLAWAGRPFSAPRARPVHGQAQQHGHQGREGHDGGGVDRGGPGQ